MTAEDAVGVPGLRLLALGCDFGWLVVLVFLVFLNRAVAESDLRAAKVTMGNRRRVRATATKDSTEIERGKANFTSAR